MIFIKILRFFLGTVRFETKGGFIGRFINLCHMEKIPLWNITSDDTHVTAQTSIQGYKKIKKAAKKSAVRPHVIRKSGFPFILHNNRMRIGLICGLLTCMTLYLLACNCIWRVEVSGNETLSAELILDIAENAGLVRGMRKKSFSAEEIEFQLKKLLPELSWTAANIRGNTVLIAVREQKKSPDILDDTSPVNIVASFDGYIEELDLHSGTPVAITHTAIQKGDLIFSGIVTKKDGSFYTVHAKGACYAKTKHIIEGNASLNEFQQIDFFANRKSLYCFGVKIPLKGLSEKAYLIKGEKDIGSEGYLLPLGIINEYTFQTGAAAENDNKVQQILISCENFYNKYIMLCNRAEILTENISEAVDNENYILYQAECYEDIAEEKSIEIDILNTNQTNS